MHIKPLGFTPVVYINNLQSATVCAKTCACGNGILFELTLFLFVLKFCLYMYISCTSVTGWLRKNPTVNVKVACELDFWPFCCIASFNISNYVVVNVNKLSWICLPFCRLQSMWTVILLHVHVPTGNIKDSSIKSNRNQIFKSTKCWAAKITMLLNKVSN